LSKPTYKVEFMPDGKSAEVTPDKTLLDAARQAGVYVNSLCGGDGICGRCRVILRDGQIEEAPHSLLTREEVQRSYVLACKSCPRSDLVVEVPIESRLEGGQIVKDADAVRFKGLRRASPSYDPLIQKMYLDMTAPSIADPLADLQRLYREIRRHSDTPIMQMGLAQTQRIANILRDNRWRVTVTVGQRGGTVEVTEVEGGDTSERVYAVAVDIGTTTVVAHLVYLHTGGTCGAEAMYNPQIKFGEDVISRIVFAQRDNGLEKLHSTVVGAINDLVGLLAREHGIRQHDILAVAVAGNTTMIHLLYNLDPSNIRLDRSALSRWGYAPTRAVCFIAYPR